jgi:hypothetical protein
VEEVHIGAIVRIPDPEPGEPLDWEMVEHAKTRVRTSIGLVFALTWFVVWANWETEYFERLAIE